MKVGVKMNKKLFKLVVVVFDGLIWCSLTIPYASYAAESLNNTESIAEDTFSVYEQYNRAYQRTLDSYFL